ncbi:MAG: 16S rRNA (adenine(1518)-N(6)/adenine(1519)-N(6))-dimethyltransferase RsmA [Pseudobdellovibrionaceae bacterium]
MSETWDRLQLTLAELGIEPKKSLGQNFLISDLVIKKIIQAARETTPGFLIEIGPGPGALTNHLRSLTENFQLIELDHKISDYWRKQGMNLIEADALQMDWSDLLKKERPLVLVSNLPYQISSSLVIERSLDENPLDRMILMFQKEVAQRLRARQQDELYGMLSVVAQSFWKMETLADVSPRDFFPPPKVASRVLTFEKKESPVSNKKRYLKFVKAAFLHPRKLMASNLEEGFSISKEKTMEALKKRQLSEKARAGQLSVQQFVDFYHELS